MLFADPTTADERVAVAESCATGLKFSIPTLIDDMDNSTEAAYTAKPDRLYLIGADGRIVYKSGPGPFGFRMKPFAAAIENYLSPAD